MSLALIEKGFSVVGIEQSLKKINLLKNGKSDIKEPNIEIKLKNAIKQNKIILKQKINRLNNDKSIFIVTVGTSIENNKKISFKYIEPICNDLSKVVLDDDLIIMRSTLMVGDSKKIYKKIKDKSKKNILLAYCPERTVEGNAIFEIFNLPQIIGAVDLKSKKTAISFFSQFNKNIVISSTTESAEMTKLVNNSYRDLIFSFSNYVASICNSMGINSREVIDNANKRYHRSNIASPGPVGGYCLEKDPLILEASGKKNGIDLKLLKDARYINKTVIINFIINIINQYKPNCKTVSLVGLSFKGNPETLDLRGSPAIYIANSICEKLNVKSILGFEPIGHLNNQTLIQNKITQKNNILDTVKKTDVVIICNNSKKVKNLRNDIVKSINKNTIIIDLWDIFTVDQKEKIGKERLFVW